MEMLSRLPTGVVGEVDGLTQGIGDPNGVVHRVVENSGDATSRIGDPSDIAFGVVDQAGDCATGVSDAGQVCLGYRRCSW